MTGFEVAIASAAIAGAGVAGASYIQQGKAQKKAESAQEQQLANQSRIENEAKLRMANEESEQTAIDTRNTAKQRQRARTVGAGGRQDTILTGPQGVGAAPSGGQKTLLGT